MDAIDVDLPTEQVVDAALKSSHTRLPLWRGEREEIVGILHAKTLLRALREARGDLTKLDILSLSTQPWFVPDSTTLKDQLNAFLKRKAHFAIVVDEYGEVMLETGNRRTQVKKSSVPAKLRRYTGRLAGGQGNESCLFQPQN